MPLLVSLCDAQRSGVPAEATEELLAQEQSAGLIGPVLSAAADGVVGASLDRMGRALAMIVGRAPPDNPDGVPWLATTGGGVGDRDGAAAAGSSPASLAAARHRHQLLVARMVANLMRSASAQMSFVNARGVPALVEMAATGGADVRAEVLRALARLGATPVLRAALAADGALAPMLAALDTPTVDAPARLAAAALGRLTELPEVQVAIAEADAVPLIVSLSKTQDAEAQRHAARALGNLAGNAQCQRQIGQCGGVRPLIKSGYSRNVE
eukprot:1447272-Prymnesium_polylepis.2